MSHYAPEVVLTSPTAAKLLGDPSATVVGKEAVRSYFARGLEAYPNLKLQTSGCDVGSFQCGALLRESEGDEDGRVYGIRCGREGGQGGG